MPSVLISPPGIMNDNIVNTVNTRNSVITRTGLTYYLRCNYYVFITVITIEVNNFV
jgi:hypothetical protein